LNAHRRCAMPAGNDKWWLSDKVKSLYLLKETLVLFPNTVVKNWRCKSYAENTVRVSHVSSDNYKKKLFSHCGIFCDSAITGCVSRLSCTKLVSTTLNLRGNKRKAASIVTVCLYLQTL
jgi:hypothetical protein